MILSTRISLLKRLEKNLHLVVLLAGTLLTGCENHTQLSKFSSISEEKLTTTPNIVFIYTDDQAPWALGYSGNKQAITPNMDKLAEQGVYFPNAYTTTPVCSPSRAGMLTSRYGFEVGIDDWINTNYKTISAHEPELGLDPNLPTWPKTLQQSGYTTGLIGKWHLGIMDKYHPSQLGFDEFTGFREGGVKTVNPTLEKKGELVQYEGLTADVLTDEAIAFLNKHKNNKFALSLHYRAPHTSWLPVDEVDAAPYKNFTFEIPNPEYPDLDIKRVQRMMRDYLSSVRSVDRNLGRFLAELDKLDLAKNTVVVFTSDHGYNMGHNGIWHKGNGNWILKHKTQAVKNIPSNRRPNLYDNSLKVPLIVRWPGVIEAGVTNKTIVSNLDWFPTLVDIAQAPLPKDTIIRGQSFLLALKGKNMAENQYYYSAYSTLHQSITAMRSMSDGQYKLVKDYINKGRDEFYVLANDPAERNNLINTTDPDLQQVINQFDDLIFKKMLATDDPVLDQFFADKPKLHKN